MTEDYGQVTVTKISIPKIEKTETIDTTARGYIKN